MAEQESFVQMLARLREGNAAAADQVFAEYQRRLIGLARTRIQTWLRQKVGPEDIVQSVFATFFKHLPEGRWDLVDREGLWRLLVQITIHKCNRTVRAFHTGKRDVGAEVALDSRGPDDSTVNRQAVDTEPTPDEAAALVDLLHVLLANATDQEKRIIEMRLAGHEVAEVAAAADCSERTVQRKLGVLRQRLERLLGQVAAP